MTLIIHSMRGREIMNGEANKSFSHGPFYMFISSRRGATSARLYVIFPQNTETLIFALYLPCVSWRISQLPLGASLVLVRYVHIRYVLVHFVPIPYNPVLYLIMFLHHRPCTFHPWRARFVSFLKRHTATENVFIMSLNLLIARLVVPVFPDILGRLG
jgi:hypothetical protein